MKAAETKKVKELPLKEDSKKEEKTNEKKGKN